jgi:cbb3-type cytochrome oxidase maturation protein
MSWVYIVLAVVGLTLGCTAVLALYWAGKTGQFQDMRAGAETIFDEEEPIGKPTDMVLGKRSKKPAGGGSEVSS